MPDYIAQGLMFCGKNLRKFKCHEFNFNFKFNLREQRYSLSQYVWLYTLMLMKLIKSGQILLVYCNAIIKHHIIFCGLLMTICEDLAKKQTASELNNNSAVCHIKVLGSSPSDDRPSRAESASSVGFMFLRRGPGWQRTQDGWIGLTLPSLLYNCT